jgi:hypothetical protein
MPRAAESGQKFVVPLGAGGKLVFLGKLPVIMQSQGLLQRGQAGHRPRLAVARAGASATSGPGVPMRFVLAADVAASMRRERILATTEESS